MQAINPILQAMGSPINQPRIPSNLKQIKQAVDSIKSLQNPASAMDMLMGQQNPALKQAMDYVQTHGGDPRQAMISLAQEKGYDPNEILRQIEN